MDSKSFDLFIEAVRGKLKGVIMEKGRGLSVWIKFGDLSLRGKGWKLVVGMKVWEVE